MKSQRAARSYAKALYALAKERNQTEAVGGELASVADAIAAEPSWRHFVAQPGVSAARKRALAEDVAQRAGVSQLMRDFLGLVAAHGRGGELAEIHEAYRDLLDADVGRVRARVRTAIPLTESERATLASRLGAAVGRKVIIEEHVDPALLGGLVAEVGSLVADGSLDGQLVRMKERLAHG